MLHIPRFPKVCIIIPLMALLLSCGENRKPVPSSGGAAASEEPAPDSGPVAANADDAAGTSEAEDESRLRDAALEGLEGEVTALLEKGCDLNAMDADGRTALMYAAFNGHSAIVLDLIGHGAIVDRRDLLGRTALFFASTGPFPETVSILVDKGAAVNVVDSNEHFSPLMHAAAEGNLDVVKILIKAGADTSLKDVDGDDALSFASQGGHSEVVDYLSSL